MEKFVKRYMYTSSCISAKYLWGVRDQPNNRLLCQIVSEQVLGVYNGMTVF